MWQQAGVSGRTLEVDITAHEQDRSFTFSLIRGGLQDKKQQKLDRETYEQLTLALGHLTDPSRTPSPDSFVDFGSLLFDVVLPEAIQLALLKHDGPLVFSTQELSLAWELLCAEGRFLSLTNPFSRKLPMQELVFDEILGEPTAAAQEDSVAALIVANPAGDIPEAAEEAEEIREIFQSQGVECECLIGPAECSFMNIMARLRKRPFRFIHLACHAMYLEEQETSAIILADGGKITAQAFQRTFKGEPLVFLNSCWSAMETAQSGRSHGRQNHSGSAVVRTLNEAFCTGNRSGHARAVVGSMWWINDRVARGLAATFYSEVLSGHSLGDSLQRARVHVSRMVDDPAYWSNYVMFGDPNLQIVRADAAQPADGADAEVADGRESVARSAATENTRQNSEPAADTTPEPAPGDAPPDDGRGLSEDGIPWSDDARAVFVGAMASMTAMKWKIFSTVHLVLGLTYLEDGLISRALQRSDLEPAVARRALRELFSRNAPSNDSDADWEVSDNLSSILSTARRRARAHSLREITEASLVEALLAQKEAGGLMLLTCLDIDLEKLAADVASHSRNGVTQPLDDRTDAELFCPSGDLNRELFSEDALAALEEAVQSAYRTYWPDLRNPHILMGLINRRGSRLAMHISENQLADPNAVATAFMAAVLRKQSLNAALRPPRLHIEFLSENALKTLREAWRLITADGRRVIREADLLAGMLNDSEGFIVASLAQMGISPIDLKWERDTHGP